MKLDPTEEQQMIQAMAREFAETAIRPIAAEIDREGRFPHETVKRMGELGLMGIAIPEDWGGSGADTLAYVLALEEIAKACGSHAAIMSVNNSLYCDPVYRFGTDTQRERLLKPAATGHALGCFALTEPQAGSDARNQQTLAARDGDHYVLNGRKQFVTNGREASFALVFCATDRAKAHHGITAFVVEKGTPGFRVPRTEDKLGIRASDTAELMFEDCRVPPPTGSARRAWGSRSRWRRWTADGSASPPRPSAWRPAPSSARSPTRASGRPSAWRSASTRWSSGCSPTWRPRPTARGSSRSARPD